MKEDVGLGLYNPFFNEEKAVFGGEVAGQATLIVGGAKYRGGRTEAGSRLSVLTNENMGGASPDHTGNRTGGAGRIGGSP